MGNDSKGDFVMADVIWKDKEVYEILKGRIREQLLTCGFLIEGSAKRYCPVQTGRLRASISTNWTGSGLGRRPGDRAIRTRSGMQQFYADGVGEPPDEGPDIFTVAVGTNVFYAPFVEIGTVRCGATPFLRAAFYENLPRIKKVLGTK